jgi:hypothetical protein
MILQVQASHAPRHVVTPEALTKCAKKEYESRNLILLEIFHILQQQTHIRQHPG